MIRKLSDLGVDLADRSRSFACICGLLLLTALVSSCWSEYGCPDCHQFIGADDDRCAQCRQFGERGCGLAVSANFRPDTKHAEPMAPCDPSCCVAPKAEPVVQPDAKR